VDLFSRQYNLERRTLTTEAENLLLRYRWPGNVRELKNVVERLVVRAPGEPVCAADLPAECQRTADVLRFAAASRGADGGRDPLGPLVYRLLEDGESFWSAVHAPFMARDLSRDQLRGIVQAGLRQTAGNYRMLVEHFNMPASDYKRFLSFLRKHDCQVPFHSFRVARARAGVTAGTPALGYVEAASM
jgi:DNA-binding NtrC family response regulator